MPLKNRNQHDDRLRVQMTCPCCGSPCLIRSSDVQTKLSRASYLRCKNAICGWSGIGVFEILRTISPPSRFVDGSDAPPPADGVYEAHILAEIEADRQTELI